MPDAKLKVLVLWSPILRHDSQAAARQASAFLDDPRVEHFWDLWSYGMKTYTRLYNYPPPHHAWDIWILYPPHLRWDKNPPQEGLLLQNRNGPNRVLPGTPYTLDVLRQELHRMTSGS